MTYATTVEAPAAVEPEGWEWMVLEIMGHRKHVGRAREVEQFGIKMLRIDVPNKGDPAAHGWTTHHYTGGSIFSYTLVDEATAMRANKPYEPPGRLSLSAPDDDDVEDRDYHHG